MPREDDDAAAAIITVEAEGNFGATGNMHEPIRVGPVVYQETFLLPRNRLQNQTGVRLPGIVGAVRGEPDDSVDLPTLPEPTVELAIR
jgi:hypothetical protein